MLDMNKQEMRYSKQGERLTVYKRDNDGNIVYESYKSANGDVVYYTDDDGNKIPKVLGEKVGYSEPTFFYANISNKLSEVMVKEFGIDDSSTYVQIVTDKGELPIKAGDVVWKQSEPQYTEDGLVDEKSADYVCKGVADEGLTADLFLLQKNIK